MWDDVKCIKSADENVMKLVFTQEGDNGAVAESVLYKYPEYKDRTVICCSTQSGCPVGCRFCGTGEFFIRNLTADEIFDQVRTCMDTAYHESGTMWMDMDKIQIMFMSMGEPMLNWQEVETAIRLIHASYPHAKLLISTIGPKVVSGGKSVWDQFMLLAAEIPEIGLQFSIHEAVEAKRNSLIPYTHKLDLEGISKMGKMFLTTTGRRPFFNYCVHPDNNTNIEADLLLGILPPDIWECTLSVICEADEGVAAANQRQRELVEDFMQLMLQRGYSTRMFDPAGQDDIGGGCGQLHFVQSWAKDNPELCNRSHGAGKTRIHTPS